MVHADFCAKYAPKGGSVLDVGSGRGSYAVEMAKRGFQVCGIEINPSYNIEARGKASAANFVIDIKDGRAEHLPYPDNSFDFVNCAEVTEHVDEPRQVCQEIFRVLKPNGKAYISFHNRFGVYDYHFHQWGINWMPRAWTEQVLRALGKQKDDGTMGRQKLTTMHYYTFGQARRLLSDIGFTAEDIREEKIKKRFGALAPAILLGYRLLLRPLYFNTFHVLVKKSLYAVEASRVSL